MHHGKLNTGKSHSIRLSKEHDRVDSTDLPGPRATVQVSFTQIMTILLVCAISSFYFGQVMQRTVNKRDWKGAPASETSTGDLGHVTVAPYSSRNLGGQEIFMPTTNMISPFLQPDMILENRTDWNNIVSFGGSNTTWSKSNNLSNTELETLYNPHFQQLLVELGHVSKSFLESKNAMASSLMVLAKRSNLTLVSYHCQDLIPSEGVWCLGMLSKGHISLQTWPSRELMTLDTLAPGVPELYSLIATVPIVEEIFGITDSTDSKETPQTFWIHKRRGLHEYKDGDVNPEEADFGFMLETPSIVKEYVASVVTGFQRIDFYDIQQPTHRSLNDKDRLVYMDGVMQSRRYGEAAYHEALVHPAMFAHKMPKRVAIIGGGEGATLREVLKHKTVQIVVMVEIDELMVNASKQYLPEWSDCSDLVGVESNCFDDPRAEIVYSDAIQWFIDRFGTETRGRLVDAFDVVIMDALDPNSAVDFSDFLYDNDNFTEAIFNSLGDSGVLVSQMGQTDIADAAPAHYNEANLAVTFIEALVEEGFQSINMYTESHGRFDAPWKYFVGLKDMSSKSNWMKSDSEIAIAIKKRIVSTVSGDSPLRYFDGATMKTYEFPDRLIENRWCGDFPEWCNDGHGYDPEITNAPRSLFEVGNSNIAVGGRGVFAKDFVKEGTYIGLEECVHGMFVPPTTYELMGLAVQNFHNNDYLHCLANGYVDGYGWTDNEYGNTCAGVDPGILTFINHGCNGTYNVGIPLNETEATLKVGSGSQRMYERSLDGYNPFAERRFPLWFCEDYKTLRDINRGDELFDNYIVFGGKDNWDANLQELQEICSGKSGTVSLYEQSGVGILEK